MNLKEFLATTVEQYPNQVALRFKHAQSWQEWTYDQLLRQVWLVAEALTGLGAEPGDRIALFSDNSPHWPAAYFAIVGLGATAVPVDSKLQEQEVAHILNDAKARLVISGSRQYTILREVHNQLPALQQVVILDGDLNTPIHSDRIEYHVLESLVADLATQAEDPGRAYDRVDPDDDTIASFIYTSGTTGRQKGAMITHANFCANVASCRKAWGMGSTDNFLLILPLHHAFAFTGNLLLPIACGASISMVESLRTIGENIREVSPTMFIGVPLLVEKMHNRIMDGLKQNRIASLLWTLGIRGTIRRKVRATLGGQLRMVITGGAPCDPEVLKGFHQLGIHILEGYGLTEASPVLSINPPERPKPGTIGKPLDGVEIEILNPNEEGIGELVARGPNIMKGYFQNPEATESVFKDGWLLTGDLGFKDPDGYITITGRRKSLIVNREGKNIYPEEVEAQLLSSPYILEAVVLGYQDADQQSGEKVGVIVVPNKERFDEDRSTDQAQTTSEIADRLRAEVKRTSALVAPYKRPRKIQVRMEEFEKTSTGKVKRYLYQMETTQVE